MSFVARDTSPGAPTWFAQPPTLPLPRDYFGPRAGMIDEPPSGHVTHAAQHDTPPEGKVSQMPCPKGRKPPIRQAKKWGQREPAPWKVLGEDA